MEAVARRAEALTGPRHGPENAHALLSPATGAETTTMPRARSSLQAIIRGGIVLGAIVGMMQADAVFAYVQTGGAGSGEVAVSHRKSVV